MDYSYIINPLTNRKVSIYSRKGQSILKEYVTQLGGDDNDCKLNPTSDRCGRSKKHTDNPELCEEGPRTKAGHRSCRKVKSAKTGKSSSSGYDANDRHETRRKPGTRGEHLEGLAGLGYGGGYQLGGDGNDCKLNPTTNRCGRSKEHTDNPELCEEGPRTKAGHHSCRKVKSAKTGKSSSSGYDANDRHETRRKPGTRGEHLEGLAGLGYGGSGSSKSPCRGYANKPSCPSGCKKVTVSKGKRKGHTFCTPLVHKKKGSHSTAHDDPPLRHDAHEETPLRHEAHEFVPSSDYREDSVSDSDISSRQEEHAAAFHPGHCKAIHQGYNELSYDDKALAAQKCQDDINCTWKKNNQCHKKKLTRQGPAIRPQ